MIPLPIATTDQNLRALARLEYDTFTGITGSTVTLTQNPVETYLFIFKNGLLLHNVGGADWSIAGTTLTLAVALVGTDKVTALYYTRSD